MSTPNPLIPQGTLQAKASRGASNIRIAVATIIAIHVVFFGGLLLQGCKRDNKGGLAAQGLKPERSNSAKSFTSPVHQRQIMLEGSRRNRTIDIRQRHSPALRLGNRTAQRSPMLLVTGSRRVGAVSPLK